MVSAHDRLTEAKMTRYACKSCNWEKIKKKVAMCMCMCVSRSWIFGEMMMILMMVMVMTNWLLLSSTLPTYPTLHAPVE